MIVASRQEGFTAVELLITLFVAAAFLATGFQLYTAIIQRGGDARQMAIASNYAYSSLRSLAATTPACSTTPTVTTTTPTIAGLTSPTVTQTTSAPHGCPWTNDVMQVQVDVTYGPTNNREEVSHALYVQR